jgi:hypothetical protein
MFHKHRSNRRSYGPQVQCVPPLVYNVTQSFHHGCQPVRQTNAVDGRSPLPGQPFDDPIARKINRSRRYVSSAEIGQRMGDSSRAAPRHSKHKVQRYAQCLRAVDVSKAWWISNNSICNERFLRMRIMLNASPPASLEQLQDHVAFSLNIALVQTLHTWNEPWILYHVRHELLWVAPDGKELQA